MPRVAHIAFTGVLVTFAQAFRSPLLVRPCRLLRLSLSLSSDDSLQSTEFTARHVPLERDPTDDLTAQELESRFADVLSYFDSLLPGDPAIAHFTETYTPQMALMRGRLPNLLLSRCRAQNSTIPGAGNGLFATRNIISGELITLYPGDAILFRAGEKEEVTGVLYGDKQQDLGLTSDDARAYETRLSSIHSIVADKDRISDAAYLAHIANDGAILTEGNDAARTVYSRVSAEAATSALQSILGGCHVGLFALRDIECGSEIFVSYGEGYWLSRGSNELFQEAVRGDEKREMANNAKKPHAKSRARNTSRGFQ